MRPFLSCLIQENLVNLSETVRHLEKKQTIQGMSYLLTTDNFRVQ